MKKKRKEESILFKKKFFRELDLKHTLVLKIMFLMIVPKTRKRNNLREI